jgi:hypothetical protein
MRRGLPEGQKQEGAPTFTLPGAKALLYIDHNGRHHDQYTH